MSISQHSREASRTSSIAILRDTINFLNLSSRRRKTDSVNMAPDVNSLPPSRSISSSPNQNRAFPPAPGSESQPRNTPSPRPSVSLAAAATLNAADRTTTNEQVSPAVRRASARRRSNVAMNLQLNDPTLPSPGELASNSHRSSISSAFRTASPTNIGGTPAIATGDPHHQRAPSLGEIHQELEQEQEAQVVSIL